MITNSWESYVFEVLKTLKDAMAIRGEAMSLMDSTIRDHSNKALLPAVFSFIPFRAFVKGRQLFNDLFSA